MTYGKRERFDLRLGFHAQFTEFLLLQSQRKCDFPFLPSLAIAPWLSRLGYRALAIAPWLSRLGYRAPRSSLKIYLIWSKYARN